jgi:hypothetical protein
VVRGRWMVLGGHILLSVPYPLARAR